jgi:cytochrome b561
LHLIQGVMMLQRDAPSTTAIRFLPSSAATSRNRFTPLAQALHWLTALLVLATVVIAWHMKMLQRTDETRENWYYVHEAIGATIFALTVIRLGWRWQNPPPPLPGKLSLVERSLAAASHWSLYAILIVMPLSGYCLISSGGHALHYFGLFTLGPFLPQSRELVDFGRAVHAIVQWAVYALVALHVLATAWDVVVRRDGVLDRMLPPQDRK